MSALSKDFESPNVKCGENPIETRRLLLRPFSLMDAAAVSILLNDRDVASNTRSVNVPYSVESAVELIKNQTKLRENGKVYAFAVCQTDSTSEERLLGGVSLTINNTDHNGELGYWIGKDFWNRGYATEACLPMLGFGFEMLGLEKLTAHHLARNPASGRVLQKIGMTKEGVCRNHVRKWGVFEDVVLYGMLSKDKRPDILSANGQ